MLVRPTYVLGATKAPRGGGNEIPAKMQPRIVSLSMWRRWIGRRIVVATRLARDERKDLVQARGWSVADRGFGSRRCS